MSIFHFSFWVSGFCKGKPGFCCKTEEGMLDSKCRCLLRESDGRLEAVCVPGRWGVREWMGRRDPSRPSRCFLM